MALGTTDLLGRRLDRLRSARPPTARSQADRPGRTMPARWRMPSAGGSIGPQPARSCGVETRVRGRRRPAALAQPSPTRSAPISRWCASTWRRPGWPRPPGRVAFLVGLGFWDGTRLHGAPAAAAGSRRRARAARRAGGALPGRRLAGDLQRPDASTGRCWWRASGCIAARRRRTAGHLDLLPVARQLWKHRLGNARLATVEDAVCAVVRDGDLPGALIPERYFSYLRSRRGGAAARRGRAQPPGHRVARAAARGAWAATPRPRTGRGSHPGDLAGLARGFVARGRHRRRSRVASRRRWRPMRGRSA